MRALDVSKAIELEAGEHPKRRASSLDSNTIAKGIHHPIVTVLLDLPNECFELVAGFLPAVLKHFSLVQKRSRKMSLRSRLADQISDSSAEKVLALCASRRVL